MENIKQLLESKLTKIKFYSAGHIVYNDKHKKVNKPGHPDNTPINKDTNVLKANLNNEYIVIDADSCNLTTLEYIYPSIRNTFTTRTTDTNKRHYWFQASPTIKNIRAIKLQADGEYDIITKGIVYEGHNIKSDDPALSPDNDQAEPWTIVNDTPPAVLTTEELKTIQDIQQTTYNPSTTGVYFVNEEVAKLVRRVVLAETFGTPAKRTSKDGKSKYIPASLTLTKAEHNKLLLGIMNQTFREDNKASRARLDFPPLSHMTINTMAYKLSYNALIDHATRDSFLTILLRDIYGIDPNSEETQRRLNTQILGTLPTHDVMLTRNGRTYSYDEETRLEESIATTDINGWGVVKFISNKDIVFMEINTTTLKPRQTGMGDQPFISAQALLQDRLYTKEDLQLIPKVKVVDDPFMTGRVGYDLANEIDTINLSQQSRYQEQAYPQDTLPDSPLRRLIYSYFNEGDAEFYLHWLAHCMYGERPPQTVVALVAAQEDLAGVGKSLLTQGIPQLLIEASATAKIDGVDRWGNMVMGKRLVTFNDMPKLSSSAWATTTAFIRDRTTGGAKRIDDVKYGVPVTTTNAVAFAMSANFIPPLEEHDRRWWVALPAQIYGSPKTSLLSPDDAAWLSANIESSRSDEIEEVQQLANYLLYLYQTEPKKHYNGLFNVAPSTLGKEIAQRQDRNYSAQLPKLVQQGPYAMSELFEESAVARWAPFILFQTHNGAAALPYRLFSEMLQALHPEDELKTTPVKVASALQIDRSRFATRSEVYRAYRDQSQLTKLGISPDFAEYPVASYMVDISEEVENEYRDFIEEHTTEIKEVDV